MIECRTAIEAVHEINDYVHNFVGQPLFVGIQGNVEYSQILEMLNNDPDKIIVRMSDFCTSEFPPSPTFFLDSVFDEAGDRVPVWIGASASLMFYGIKAAESFFIDTLGRTFQMPLIILCPFFSGSLSRIASDYVKLGRSIINVHGIPQKIPTIYINEEDCIFKADKKAIGIKQFFQTIENDISPLSYFCITSLKPSILKDSMFPVSGVPSAYETVCSMDSMIRNASCEAMGTKKQWEDLAKELVNRPFAEIVATKITSLPTLKTEFTDYIEADDDQSFLCFLAMKVFFSRDNTYLSLCLQCSQTKDDFKCRIYDSILNVSHTDAQFIPFMKARRRLLSSMEESSALMKDFCENATIMQKDILWYLSEDTEEERNAIIHALCTYNYTTNELQAMLSACAPSLSTYLNRFSFTAFNTRVLEKNNYIPQLLTDYFDRYKLQKITNRIDDEFVELVEKEASELRDYTKLPSRSQIVKQLNKSDARAYFFDGLGVEFLAYIIAKAEEYGIVAEIKVGVCNLPSITSKNKEFYEQFPDIFKEERIDDLIHDGAKYDYRVTKEPLHIFAELDVIDENLKKMASLLSEGKIKRVIILSDHGASRLAVRYESENDKLELEKPGEHSGRCCPSAYDPQIPFAFYEDGFSVLGNYERFKGGRKADVEAHGGATLEEVLVPVITLTNKPKEQTIFFKENGEFKCSVKDGTTVKLFANPPLNDPKIAVNGKTYCGTYDGDNHNVQFALSDIRRKSEYDADVYDGDKIIARLKFKTTKATGMKDLF